MGILTAEEQKMLRTCECGHPKVRHVVYGGCQYHPGICECSLSMEQVMDQSLEKLIKKKMAEAQLDLLLNLRVALQDFVRDSGLKQKEIARRAQITEKHMSQMLVHGRGKLDTWMRVVHAIVEGESR